jgi:hypothetical protein
MGSLLPERLKWLEHALQGIAFWIGHRHSLFKDYPLSEGALVAEACNLIQANLPHGFVLLPECMYKNLVPEDSAAEGISYQARADLVLCDIAAKRVGRDGNVATHTRVVIEVKRAKASTKSVNEDLSRLHALLKVAKKGTRCFLFVISESNAPKRFVIEGKSKVGLHPIPGTTGSFRVRRTMKATASFSAKESAHYVCLLEIFL